MEQKIFYCERDGLKIYVKEFIRAEIREHTRPAIIVSHGFGNNSMEMEKYCESFANEGYAAYCFDFCGGSRTGESRSEGNSLDMTIDSECMDLITVLNQVKSFAYIDKNRISLLGASQGGLVSAITAARYQEKIENLILLYPAFCIPDDAREGRLGGANYHIKEVPEIIHCTNEMKIGRKFHENVVHRNPYQDIVGFTGRVLLIHGKKDDIVNYSYAIKAQASYKEGQCKLHLIENAGHSFNANQSESAMIAMNQFLKRKKELLTIRVILTETRILEKRDDYCKTAVYFTGYCDNDIFKGCILPGAVDIQEQIGDAPKIIRANYSILGVDAKRNACCLHIINQKKGEFFKPSIETDSIELAYLNTSDLTASLEHYPGGLTVRVFG